MQRGRIVTLIGPNGSGKSTILKTIIGQLPSISGSVFLDGADMRSRSRGDVARRMAILMTARMDPELMTCRDVVSTGRYPYTGHLGVLRPEDKAIVEQSLRETDALDFADRPFQSISDGQRQRVLLARALCQQPELIVLDEPTSFLDIRYKLELLSILKRMVREEHLAVLMSLHELDLAARVSDTVVCVAGDRIDRVGPPSEIFTPDYIAALSRMIGMFRSAGVPTVIFATTTYSHPEGSAMRPEAAIDLYNASAAALMACEGVEVNDLGGFQRKHLEEFLCEDGLHLNEKGYRACAQQVADAIRRHL